MRGMSIEEAGDIVSLLLYREYIYLNIYFRSEFVEITDYNWLLVAKAVMKNFEIFENNRINTVSAMYTRKV